MKFALCNEMFQNRPMTEVCSAALRLGYDGIEIAPFTLARRADEISSAQRQETRKIIEDHGLETVGLHWLLAGTEGIHLTSPDNETRERTRDCLNALLHLCYDLGGKVLIIGSPKQRNLAKNQPFMDGWDRLVDLFQSVMPKTNQLDLTWCIEPLAPVETNFINTVDEGLRLVRQINHRSFKIHLDVKAMWAQNTDVAEVIRSVPTGDIGHFHVNDPNYYGPGMGDVDYTPIADAINDIGYNGWLSVEVFKYDPDGETIARRSREYLRKFWPDNG